MGIDYKCGTGHGVGHLMNVRRANGFRWKAVPERNDSCVLEEGMTQSNEPGVYVGSHGIRHENELVVRRGEKTNTDSSCILKQSHLYHLIWMG